MPKYALKEDLIAKNPMIAITLKKDDTAKKEIEIFTNISKKKMTYEGQRIQVIKAPKTKNGVRVVPISDKLLPYIHNHALVPLHAVIGKLQQCKTALKVL